MLAITHHFIVQSAAWISGVCPQNRIFTSYAVLGDDIVIWNRTVARQYLRMMKQLGVGVGLAKSVVSPKGRGLEFAKKTLIMGYDCSPIPFKEQSAAHQNFSQLRGFCLKYSVSFSKALKFLGYGYKVTPFSNKQVVKTINLALAIPRTVNGLLSMFFLSTDWIGPTFSID